MILLKKQNVRRNLLLTSILFLFYFPLSAQQLSKDTLTHTLDTTSLPASRTNNYGNGISYYSKPRNFSFLTQLPRTFSESFKESIRKESLPAWLTIASSTLILISIDQDIFEGMNRFSKKIGLIPDREYRTLVSFNLGSTAVNVYEAPRNFNTLLYSIGEGSSSIVLCTGFYLFGKIKKDYRALQTASQLMQSLLAVGVTTQLIKRITGRETPFHATAPGGVWRPFPSFSKYQSRVSKYDAFPSGHIATMMATVTVIAENYKQKKWIKPLGYSLMGVVGLAMINNGVHWASDYPLSIGLGYVCAKVSVKMSQAIQKRY